MTDLVNGIGDEALPGIIVIVHYTGFFVPIFVSFAASWSLSFWRPYEAT